MDLIQTVVHGLKWLGKSILFIKARKIKQLNVIATHFSGEKNNTDKKNAVERQWQEEGKHIAKPQS